MSRRIMSKSLLFKFAGWGAFFSLGLFLTGFFVSFSNEDFGEFLILCSPTLPLLPMVLAFYRIHHSRFPYWSQVVRIVGIIGATSILITPIPHLLDLINLSAYGSAIVLCTIACIGVWLLLNGWLGLHSRAIPRLLAKLSIAVGVAWLIAIASTVLGLFNSSLVQSLMTLWAVNILALIGGYLLWTIWVGCWFLTRHVNNSFI